MSLRYPTLLFLSVIGLSASCSKDEAPSAAAEMLMARKWVIVDRTTLLGTSIRNESIMTLPCGKDDYLLFLAGGKLEFNNSSLKCDGAEPQTVAGTWTLTNDDKSFSLVNLHSTDGRTYGSHGGRIEELTADRLVTVRTDESTLTTVIVRHTYQAQ